MNDVLVTDYMNDILVTYYRKAILNRVDRIRQG